MHDVWVSGAYDARDSKPARGAWLCPSLGVYSLTKRAKAVDMNDGLRIVCCRPLIPSGKGSLSTCPNTRPRGG